jgi:methyl-accepting chemotaxis protein
MGKGIYFRSLRLKMLVPILGLVILGLMALTGSSYYLANGVIETNIEDLASSKVSQLSTEIHGKMDVRINEIDLLAKSNTVKSMDWVQISQYLGERKEDFKDYEQLSLADQNGFFHSTTGNTGDIADSEYFNIALGGVNTVSEPFISMISGAQVIVFASPVKNADGQVVGVFAGTYEFRNISEMIKSYTLGDTGYAYIINKEGIILYHPTYNMLKPICWH